MTGAPVAVVGAGAWGTALACAAARAGLEAHLWGRDAADMARMARERINARHLPGVELPAGVMPADALEKAVAQAGSVLLAVPAQAVRAVCASLAPLIRPAMPVIMCAKGIDRETGRFMTEVASVELPAARPGILSGPSFALDVARGLPTAVAVACADEALAARIARDLSSPSLRLYHTTDIRGVEIGGAGKNVLAIAAGIVEGRGLGDSAKAALVTRGFAELRRCAAALGARPETLMGLSGLGDLMLTCSTPRSRNFALGLALGRGEPAPGALAEGAYTAGILCTVARGCGVEMPIAEEVAAILAGASSPAEALPRLMGRPLRGEE